MTNGQQERYRLEKQLGTGAMGEVWLATDTLLDRPIAIKYLKATTDVRIKDLFSSEARTLAKLNHPNITQIYDAVFDVAHNRFYIMMEFVEGEALNDIMEHWAGQFPLEMILDIAIGIVQALAYAHAQGIVHRDIKPANVMIQKEGVQLTDFGIAGLMSILAEGTDYIVGTPAYISPEQIEGLPLDGRADLYSLGIMLYEMTTGGDRPFKYKSQTKLFLAHLDENPPNLKDYSPDIPYALERAIMRLLAKRPEDRYPDAAAFLEVLQRIKARQQFSQPHLQLLDPDAHPLVGRDTEMEQIKAEWRKTQETAQPQLMVVEGPMGAGKTRLITDFLGHYIIDEGLVALAGRCHEAGVPYAPFAEILGTVFNQNLLKVPPNQGQIDALLKQIPSLARILNISEEEVRSVTSTSTPVKKPATGGLWRALTERVPTENEERNFSNDQWQFSKTVLDLLTDLGPTAIFLEDATYLDEASAALLRFLVRQEQLPLLLIAACRDNDEAPQWLSNLSVGEKQTLSLPPLTTPTIKSYLANFMSGTIAPEVVGLVEERSKGNPFRINDVAQHLIEDGEVTQDENEVWHRAKEERVGDAFLPQSVLGAFQRQIKKLTPESREALAFAALIEPGPEFDFGVWSAFLKAENAPHSAEVVIEEALKKRLVRQINEQRFIFRPPDVAKALEATLTGSRRQALHHKVAELLHQANSDPLLVAHHYEQAGEDKNAAKYLETAGGKAASAKAINAAVSYYSKAATILESPTAYQAMAELHRQQGQHEQAIDAYQQNLTIAQKIGDVVEEGRVLNSLSLTYCLNDQYQTAQEYAKQVLDLESVSNRTRAVAQSHLGMVLWLSGRLKDAEYWCQEAIKVLLEEGSQAEVAVVYYRLGLIYRSTGNFNKSRIALQHALKIRRKLEDQAGVAHCLNNLARLVAERGDFAQASSLFKAAEEAFAAIQSRDGLITVYTNQGRMLGHQGLYTQAHEVLDKALTVGKEIGEKSVHILGDIYLVLADSHIPQKPDLAKTLVEQGSQLVEKAGNQELVAYGRLLLARIYQQHNKRPSADKMFKEAIGLYEKIGSQPGLARARMRYATFLKGQPGQAANAAALEIESKAEAERMSLYLPD